MRRRFHPSLLHMDHLHWALLTCLGNGLLRLRPPLPLRSGATRHVTSQPVDTAATPRHSFFKMFDSRSPAGSFHRTNMAAPSTADMYGTQICPSPMQPSPENLNEAGLYKPPAHRCFTQKYPTQKESFPGVWPALRRWTGTCSAIEYLAGF